ncbi:2Fe-2S iron-sulfur cluster-binding protein [Umezakia ovalisporum]|jgi:ferredoxin|uniref:(2Fe-2S)-binding protein n=2 Tax=Umezakia ovalisporum TaxID=75695 RepID=A0AA43KDP9_9CYAN|nr:2Fe-2S iron-sulfur cluster-binding protein [Umezakia ovalisporum]MBI1240314.1 2Fe-2S iron-sulfur cluster binding domain-containing protein [Nostoc sp. RI_552]MDH6057229.1 (2Fe-2S)-binding protein [Umezakia ovalisporum FSS-43]MDH6062580.1 (2Fe-2S)-binding protein [Umezakia ovalisporum FSS-62]MDH6068815.1 (2Fe-2S)-binding protein [Umezakia ovalisporum APH033B]MDH6070304.1 (2Fe-2S)-binding protein [Umezakia ovalisporum CobakiLakeA]
MPKVKAQGQTIECDVGANLRGVLLQNGIDLYNGGAKLINCRGIGSCGTCAVKVEGEVSAANWRDKARRSLPPHSPTTELRLACQTEVLGDVRVTKYDGFWGQGSQIFWTPEG